MTKVLVTGAAGFIGYHVATRLLSQGVEVVGLDNLNSYYSPKLKLRRLTLLEAQKGFRFVEGSVASAAVVDSLVEEVDGGSVVHLAAQAGVRYSLVNPMAYADSNLLGFVTLVEACRKHPVKHLVFASSSSVYGSRHELPFRVADDVMHPVSLYAATKVANEAVGHSYSHLYHIPMTGLRFFTVYGPWGRPDMAYYSFAVRLMRSEPIRLFGAGALLRDFTYIDDIVEGIVRTVEAPPVKSNGAPFVVHNIGNSAPVRVTEFLAELERAMGKSAIVVNAPMQPGDVVATYADVGSLFDAVGFRPHTSLRDGLAAFASWFREHHEQEFETGEFNL